MPKYDPRFDAQVIVTIGEDPSQLRVQVEVDGVRHDLPSAVVNLRLFDHGARPRYVELELPCRVEVIEP
jgi:hypothetical protein